MKLYELKLDKDSVVLNTSETSSTKYLIGQSAMSSSSKQSKEGSDINDNRDYKKLDIEVGTKAKGDQYVGLKFI